MLYTFKAVKERSNGVLDTRQYPAATHFEHTRYPAVYLGVNYGQPRIELRLYRDITQASGDNKVTPIAIIRLPEDADTVYVMDEAGNTIDTVRVDVVAKSAAYRKT